MNYWNFLYKPESMGIYINMAKESAKKRVNGAYPYVQRSVREIDQIASKVCESEILTMRRLREGDSYPPPDGPDLDYFRSYYIAAFRDAYLSLVAEKDKQATYSKGVIRIKNVEHNGDNHNYHIELTDSAYLSKVYEFEVSISSGEIELEES